MKNKNRYSGAAGLWHTHTSFFVWFCYTVYSLFVHFVEGYRYWTGLGLEGERCIGGGATSFSKSKFGERLTESPTLPFSFFSDGRLKRRHGQRRTQIKLGACRFS